LRHHDPRWFEFLTTGYDNVAVDMQGKRSA
jgi:hypothetical protein